MCLSHFILLFPFFLFFSQSLPKSGAIVVGILGKGRDLYISPCSLTPSSHVHSWQFCKNFIMIFVSVCPKKKKVLSIQFLLTI